VNSLSDVVGNAGLARFTEIALVIFFAVFVAIVIYVFLRKKETWERARHLPLENGVAGEPEEDGR
jgi:cbb3-type cytochrome oxidase subunit 3